MTETGYLLVPTKMSPTNRHTSWMNAWFCAGLFLCAAASAYEPKQVTSPDGRFVIASELKGEQWVETLKIKGGKQPGIVLSDNFSWSSFYEISPDSRWIFRTQKTGSGENSTWLYRVDRSGRLWEMKESFSAEVLGLLAKQHGIQAKDYFHVGTAFGGWQMKKHTFLFKISGTAMSNFETHRSDGFIFEYYYHLDTGKFEAVK